MPTAQTLIDDALTELGVLAEGEVAGPSDAQRALRILNRDIIEPWTVQHYFATHRVITSGTFLASTATRTIGPTGAYVLTVRPDEILQAHWVDSDGNRTKIELKDADWYAALPNPTETGSTIEAIAYFTTFPNGTMYPWPIPESNTTVELETRSILTSFANLATSVTLAPGYESAIVYTLAERCANPFGHQISADLAYKARLARDIVRSPHMKSPSISTIPY